MSATATTAAKVTITDLSDLPRRSPSFLAQKLGDLTVIGFNRSEKLSGQDRTTFWNVQCQCSRVEVLTARQLKTHRKCARCQHADDVVKNFKPSKTQKFTIIGLHEYRLKPTHAKTNGQPPKGEFIWTCKCNCGEIFQVGSHHLKARRSCQKCLRKRLSKAVLGRRLPQSQRKYRVTTRVLELLEKAYSFKGSPQQKKKAGLTLRQIAKRLSWSNAALKDFAIAQGFSQPIHTHPFKPWSAEELQLLSDKRKACINPLDQIFRNRGFQRSKTELRDKLMELEHLEHQDSYPRKEVTRLLGLKPKEITHLIDIGQLPANLSFARDQVRTFLLTHPESYTLAKVDRVFFRLLILQNAFPEQVRQSCQASK